MTDPADEGWFHVTSARNRASIRQHGLDVGRMGAAPGIAGSAVPEQDGVFLVQGEEDADWIVGLNNTGGPVDVWAVAGVVAAELQQSPEGYRFQPGVISVERLRLVREDVPPLDRST